MIKFTPSMSLLEIRHLTTEFVTENAIIRAVDDISLSIDRGETLGIVGESASGKSVTALSIMRLIAVPPGRITHGEIIFYPDGDTPVNLLQLPEKEMRHYRGKHISMIFQEPMTSLNPVHTCGRQVMESILLHEGITRNEAKKRTLEFFGEVQISHPEVIFDAYPHQLSGGQKQRVMIAMAMSCHPSLLIADEPTTALDVTIQKTILELMKKLQQKYGMGIIFITHDLGVVAEIANRAVVMYQGKIVETGPVGQLFSNPRHPYTKGLIACRPTPHKRLRILPTVNDFMQLAEGANNHNRYTSLEEHNNKEIEISEESRQRDHENLYRKKPMLEVHHLRTYFPLAEGILKRRKGVIKAVDDVSFDVYPGETLGLVGESGCGKTTLGRSLLRLTEISGGEAIYEGRNIVTLSSNDLRLLRKDIQIIFQDPYSSLNPRMTAGKAIMEPMKTHHLYDSERMRKQKAIELLEKVGLNESHFYRYPHEFSGGQRQRICIARALAVNPKFIICDESVSALDVSIQAQVLNLLNQLKLEFGFTYIFISHDLSVVKFMSDRIVVMKDGKIEETGEADAIYNNPSSIYTRKLIDAIPKYF
jgi:peptide/nickel transport system ATP-binding protein